MWKDIYIMTLVLTGILLLGFTSKIYKESNNDSILNEKAVYKPIVVLELFTSQGCSSCPSADLLLQKVKEDYENEVFTLSYHVDYWNYIGWKDPFSKSIYTEKQRQYNVKFRNRGNYTPQLVVNGKEHFTGSNSSKLYNRINTYKELKSTNQVEIHDMTNDTKKISFEYSIQGSIKNKRLRTVLALDKCITKIKRGENSNRTLQNSNVVVEELSIDIDDNKGLMEVSIPKIVKAADKLNLIILVENLDLEITGAAKQSLVR